ncbi:Gag polyprotein [Bienertia sinuspersici]
MKIITMSNSNNNTQLIDPTSPYYIHPSDGPGSVVVDKLQGSSNYRAWRRDMELSLGAKRKLGFVTGAVKKDESDPLKKSQWDTCNDMIISWICRSICSDYGARKYSLSKQLYETRQNGRTVAEFYTEMRVMWEELESLSILPPLTEMNTEVCAYVHALYKQKEEQKLFQFLSGVDDIYSMQRSHMLHQATLPTVDEAYNMIQQEESQRNVFNHSRDDMGGMVMNTKKSDMICTNYNKPGHIKEQCWACKVCGKRGHQMDQCWYVKGFPPEFDKGKKKEDSNKERSDWIREEGTKSNPRWNKNKPPPRKVAANVKVENEKAQAVE